MAPRVSVALDADVAGYVAKMRAASTASAELGTRIGATGKEVDAAMAGMARASAQAATAATRNAAAQEAAGAKAAAASAKAAAAAKASSAEQVAAHSRSNAMMGRLGSGMMKAGAIGIVALGLLGKAAVDWESDWAGVTKTVSGTPQQLDALEGSLRGMARTLPTSTHDIAAVAEAAGQLGVKTPDVANFTRTMIDLGNTTNLSADQAATSLAQFMNIMGTAPGKVRNLANALVDLGNNGASTESQILDMSLRISGAGTQIGLSEGQVLGFSSALSSVGIQAEAGGTSMSKSFTRIGNATRTGGDALDALAKTSGVTSAQFASDFQTKPAAAMNNFVEGLGRVMASGGDVDGVLSKVGITSQREKDNFLRLAAASEAAGNKVGLLGDNVKRGDRAMQGTGAIAKEAAARYGTTASKIKVAWNQIKDAAITAGGNILPVFAGIAKGVSTMASAFGKLSAPTIKSAVAMAAIVAGVLLVGGAIIKGVTAIAAMKMAMLELSILAPRTAAAMSLMGKAAGIAGAALIVFFAAGAAVKAFKGTVVPSLEAANKAFLELKSNPGGLDKLFEVKGATGDLAKATAQVGGLEAAFGALNKSNWADSLNQKIDGLFGTTETATTQIRNSFANADASIGALTSSGHLDEAQAGFGKFADAAAHAGTSTDDLVKLFPDYAAAVTQTAAANGDAVTTSDQLVTLMRGGLPDGFHAAQGAIDPMTGAVRHIASAAELAATSLKNLTDAMATEANAALAAAGGADGLQGAINNAGRAGKTYVQAMVEKAGSDKKARKAAKEHAQAALESGKAFHGTSDESIALRTSINGVAQASLDNVQAMVNNGESIKTVSKANEKGRTAFIKAAEAIGATSTEAKKMAEDFFGLGKLNVAPKITAPSDKALKVAGLTKAAFKALPATTKAEILALYNNGRVKEADAELNAINGVVAKPTIKAPSTEALKIAGVTKAQFEAIPAVTQARIIALYNAGKIKQADAELAAIDKTVAHPGVKTKGTDKAKGDFDKVTSAAKKTDKQHPNPKAVAVGTKRAAGNFDDVTGAAKKAGKQHAKPKAVAVGTKKAKGDFDDVTSAAKRTGKTKASPGIKAPGKQAKKVADDTTDAVKKTGKAKASPGIKAPSRAAKKVADDTLASFRRLGGYTATPRISVSSNAAGVAARARASINSVHSKSVSITVTKKTKAAGGGYIEGPGTATSDSIDASLSNGEFVMRAAATKAIGVGNLYAMNALGGYAAGGLVGGKPKERFAAGGLVGAPANVNVAQLVALIAAVADPLRNLSAATTAVAAAMVKYQAAQATLVKPRATLALATKNDAAARDAAKALALQNAQQLADAKARVAKARAAVNSGSATKAEKKELKRALAAQAKVSRDNALEVAKANAKITATTKVKTAAATAYNAAADKTKAATDALKAANEALASQQQAVADSARQVAATFASNYDSTDYTDPADVIAAKTQGAADLAAFNKKLLALRAAGVNATDIQAVVDKGVDGGGEMADAILAGGSDMVAALNLAQANLAKAAEALGLTVATGAVKKSMGGWVSGPGTSTSDSVHLMASDREFVVNAASAAANAGLLDQINSSPRSVITRNFASGMSSAPTSTRASSPRDGRPGAVIHQHFPASANPRAAASAAGGRVVAALSAKGV